MRTHATATITYSYMHTLLSLPPPHATVPTAAPTQTTSSSKWGTYDHAVGTGQYIPRQRDKRMNEGHANFFKDNPEYKPTSGRFNAAAGIPLGAWHWLTSTDGDSMGMLLEISTTYELLPGNYAERGMNWCNDAETFFRDRRCLYFLYQIWQACELAKQSLNETDQLQSPMRLASLVERHEAAAVSMAAAIGYRAEQAAAAAAAVVAPIVQAAEAAGPEEIGYEMTESDGGVWKITGYDVMSNNFLWTMVKAASASSSSSNSSSSNSSSSGSGGSSGDEEAASEEAARDKLVLLGDPRCELKDAPCLLRRVCLEYMADSSKAPARSEFKVELAEEGLEGTVPVGRAKAADLRQVLSLFGLQAAKQLDRKEMLWRLLRAFDRARGIGPKGMHVDKMRKAGFGPEIAFNGLGKNLPRLTGVMLWPELWHCVFSLLGYLVLGGGSGKKEEHEVAMADKRIFWHLWTKPYIKRKFQGSLRQSAEMRWSKQSMHLGFGDMYLLVGVRREAWLEIRQQVLDFIVKWQEGSGEEGKKEEEEEEESSGDDEEAATDAPADSAEQQRQEDARKWSEYQRRSPIRPDVELLLTSLDSLDRVALDYIPHLKRGARDMVLTHTAEIIRALSMTKRKTYLKAMILMLNDIYHLKSAKPKLFEACMNNFNILVGVWIEEQHKILSMIAAKGQRGTIESINLAVRNIRRFMEACDMLEQYGMPGGHAYYTPNAQDETSGADKEIWKELIWRQVKRALKGKSRLALGERGVVEQSVFRVQGKPIEYPSSLLQSVGGTAEAMDRAIDEANTSNESGLKQSVREPTAPKGGGGVQTQESGKAEAEEAEEEEAEEEEEAAEEEAEEEIVLTWSETFGPRYIDLDNSSCSSDDEEEEGSGSFQNPGLSSCSSRSAAAIVACQTHGRWSPRKLVYEWGKNQRRNPVVPGGGGWDYNKMERHVNCLLEDEAAQTE